MQGLIAAALVPAAPEGSTPADHRPLSSANLALHTSRNPPAPRRSVQSFLASVAPVHAANAYDLGPPAEGELDHVKTPPRAVEVKRKRRLQDLEDRGETWIWNDGYRAVANGTEPALVMLAADDAPPRTSTVGGPQERKKTLVASMMRKRSTPVATRAEGSQLSPAGRALASSESSILLPRGGPRLGATAGKSGTDVKRGKEKDGIGKENRPSKPTTSRKRKTAIRDGRDMDTEEEEELDDLQARLRARRERRRQNALIRKDRSLAAATVGANAAAKVKRANKRAVAASSEGESENGRADEEDAIEISGRRGKGKRTAKEDRSRSKVAALDRPGHVGPGRLTLEPAGLGIFSKGKASGSAKTGTHRKSPDLCTATTTRAILTQDQFAELAFDEEAFLSGTRRRDAAASSAASTSSAKKLAHERRLNASPHRSAGNKGVRTYGSRPSKRRSASIHRQRVPSPALMHDHATGRHSGDESFTAAVAIPGQNHGVESHTAAPTRLPERSEKKKRSPTFWLDIAPWPTRSSSSRVLRPASKAESALIGADDVDDVSTHPSVLSAASLARRKARRLELEKRTSMSTKGLAAVGANGGPRDTVVIQPTDGEGEGADAGGIGDSGPLPDPVSGDGSAERCDEEELDRSGAFERLLAQVASAAAGGPVEEEPVSFEAFAGGDGYGSPTAVIPHQASFAKDVVISNADLGGFHADDGAFFDAAIEQEFGPSARDHGELAPYFDGISAEEAEPITFRLGEAGTAPIVVGAAAAMDGRDRHRELFPERFPTPSSLAPSLVDDSWTPMNAGDPAPTGYADEAAFRTAMRQHWPRTVL
ncbi:hypothetical protein JCM3774_005818 [Rhodotorula dairenensis]